MNSAGKKILVLSDNDVLFTAIELSLSHLRGIEIVKPAWNPPGQQGGQAKSNNLGLIVVATSSPASEPLTMLFKASVLGRVGQVPLMIISDRPFHSEPGGKIFHLDFPFDIDELPHTVKKILEKQAQAASAEDTPFEKTRPAQKADSIPHANRTPA